MLVIVIVCIILSICCLVPGTKTYSRDKDCCPIRLCMPPCGIQILMKLFCPQTLCGIHPERVESGGCACATICEPPQRVEPQQAAPQALVVRDTGGRAKGQGGAMYV